MRALAFFVMLAFLMAVSCLQVQVKREAKTHAEIRAHVRQLLVPRK